MDVPRIHLKPRRDASIAAGSLWVFKNDVARVEGAFENGGPADLLDQDGKVLGRGLVSLDSSIVMRLLARQAVDLDEGFFRARLAAAIDLRRRAGLPGPGTDAFRLVFSEADGLPGLVVDRFGDRLVLSALTVGIDRRREMLARHLLELTGARAVLERSDAPVRALEGLEPRVGPLLDASEGAAGEATAMENGLRFHLDLEAGMKTGHFCDQRENRLRVRGLAAGARALDVFCSTGGFALNMAAGGAASVTAVDSSEEALRALEANIALNGLDRSLFTLRAGNGFEVLRELASAEPRSFDLVVLDPPAFAKARGGVEGALRGYKEINIRAMKLLRDGGVLLTASCSHHVDRWAFRQILRRASKDSHRPMRLLGEFGHAPDHPVLLHWPEGEYLKASLLQAVEF